VIVVVVVVVVVVVATEVQEAAGVAADDGAHCANHFRYLRLSILFLSAPDFIMTGLLNHKASPHFYGFLFKVCFKLNFLFFQIVCTS